MFNIEQESVDYPSDGTGKVYDPFVLPVQPITLQHHPLSSPVAPFSFPFLNCTAPTTVCLTHSVSVPSEMHWQSVTSKANKQEKVLTPTNVQGSIFTTGLTTTTPEFVHPRNLNVPQWLMSPPVGNGNPGIGSHSPTSDSAVAPVSKHLLTPEDFVLHNNDEIMSHFCCKFKSNCLCGLSTPSDFVLHSTKNVTHERDCTLVDTGFKTECTKKCILDEFSGSENKGSHLSSASSNCTNCLDSGISTPANDCSSFIQSKSDKFMKSVYSLSKRCRNFVDFQHEMTKLYPHHVCDAVLSYLTELSLSQMNLHHHLFNKLTSESTSAHSVDKSQKCPIAVFWDLENCQVPSGKSALSIVQKIRKTFFEADHSEEEFMAVCDINKERKNVIQDLNNAQVNVIHVNATAKNAADDKLRQSIRRYAHCHKAPATIILITGDCNFMSEVSDLRHRHKFFVVLIHQVNSSDALIQSACSAVSYEEFVDDLPTVYPRKGDPSNVQLLVTNLPSVDDINLIRVRLKSLSFNCGGKVLRLSPPTALMKFNTEELAKRALKRLNGEDVFGKKISVQFATSGLSALSQHFTPRRRQHKVQQKQPPRQPVGEGSPCEETKLFKKEDNRGIQLTISNIDSQLGMRTIQEKILSLVSESCVVWQLQVRPHNRFTVMCDVTVPNVNAALRVLLQLHRRKMGGKRVLVTITQQPPPPAQLRNELIFLLQEHGRDGIHINKLSSLYMRNYRKQLSLEDLKEVDGLVTVSDREEGMFVSTRNDVEMLDVCQKHYRPNSFRHTDTKIELCLREFSAKLHALLHSHSGVLHLQGFERCYEAEFGSFPHPKKGQGGVYLEHEISYVPGVHIVDGQSKMIVWSQPHSDSGSDTVSESSSSSRLGTSALLSFTKELIDLLKTCRCCCMPFDDFKSKYQLHFGKPFHIAGFSGLYDVLASLPHVVQVIGLSENRLITLTHRAQVKRFTQEIIKILKTSPDRAILLAQLPDMYLKTLSRPWSVYDYGVCMLSDLLDDIPDGNICVSGEGDNIILSLPKRERSTDEVMRTNQFSREIIEILKSQVRFRMRFTDFVPAYHRHFGRQCKLARYGFSKLIDLFEAIPHAVQVKDELADKFLQLADEERLKVLTSQIIGIIRKPNSESEVDQHSGVPLQRLQSLYLRKYGFPLVPKEYNCTTLEAVIRMLGHAVKIGKDTQGGFVVKPAERKPLRLLAAQLLVLLLDIGGDCVRWEELHQAYQDRYKEEVTATEFGFISISDVVEKALSGIAKLEYMDGCLLLHVKPIYLVAKRARDILLEHGGTMSLGDFNQAYRLQHGEPLDAEHHGFRSVEAMLRALSSVLVVKGFGIKKTLALRNHMQYGPLSASLPTVEKQCHHKDESGVSSSTKPRPLRDIISSGISPPRKMEPPEAIHLPEDPQQLFRMPEPDCINTTPQYVYTSGIELYHRYQSIGGHPPAQLFKPAWSQLSSVESFKPSDAYAPTASSNHCGVHTRSTEPSSGPISLSNATFSLSSSQDSFPSMSEGTKLQLVDNHGNSTPPHGLWSIPFSST